MTNDYKRTITYKETIDTQCEARIEELLDELPEYCRAFTLNRQDRTQIRTRKENLRDIKVFFTFLITQNPTFAAMGMKNIPADALERLTVADFDDFTSWLAKYTLSHEDGDKTTYENSRVSIKRKLSSVRSLYKFLYDREYILSNPCLKKEMPKIPKKDSSTTVILEKYQRESFFNAVEEAYEKATEKIDKEIETKGAATKRTLLLPAIAMRDRAMIYLLISTGMRLSELCGIDCTDYSRELGTINIIRKGGKLDKIYLSEKAQKALDIYLDEFRYQFEPNNDNYQAMFLSERKSRITPRSVELAVKHIADASLGTNNKISPHKLRATFGTEYYLQTKDLLATANAMGHESIETTKEFYVKENEDAKKQARNIVF